MFLNDHSLEVGNFATKNKERPILSCVAVLKDRCVATDSYTLLEVMHQDQDIDNPLQLPNDQRTGLIPASAALHASKNIPKKKEEDDAQLFKINYACSSIDEKEKTMLLSSTDIEQEKTVEAKMIDGEYPKYETVFPKEVPSIRVVLDAKYLKRMADYMAKHAEGGYVEMQLHGDKSPVVFKAIGKGTRQPIRGMVMPCRKELGEEVDEEMARRVKELTQTSIPDCKVSFSFNGHEYN